MESQQLSQHSPISHFPTDLTANVFFMPSELSEQRRKTHVTLMSNKVFA